MTIEPAAATPTRRLTAVLLADVVGYSRMMSRDEDATHARIVLYARELVDPTIAKYGGRFVRSMGDGMLVEFASALDAVRCALDIQRGLAAHQAEEPDRVQLRIGINTGDVLVDHRDIYGTSINITARLEALAVPGGVCVSQSIHDQTRSQPDLFFADRGTHRVKNIDYPIHVFEVTYEPIPAPFLAQLLARRTQWAFAAVIAVITLVSAAALLTFGGQRQVIARTNAIVVLPFRNIDGNPADDYLADAITDDLTTELSRLRRAWVIASGTALTYKGKAIDVRRIGREIGVRYALEGSVRRAGAFIQVNAELIDTESGTNLWANRFRHQTSSLLDLQDAVTDRIAGSLDDQVMNAGVRHEVGTFAADGNPLDERLRAMAANTGMPTPAKYRAMRRHAEAGLKADPDNARLLALLATALVSDYLNGWNKAKIADVDRAERKADKAIALDPTVALAYYARGFVRRVHGDHKGALEAFEEAIERDRSFAKAYVQKANELVFLGQPKDAIPMVEKAAQLSPKDPSIGVFLWVEGRAYFTLGDYENAIKSLEKSVRLRSNLWFSQAWLIAAYAQSKRATEMQTLREKFKKAFPTYNLAEITKIYGEENQYNNPTLKTASAALLKGLRDAGLR